MSHGSIALAMSVHAAVNIATAVAVGSLPEAHRPTSWFATGIVWFAAGLLLELASLAAGARRRLSSR
jgi:hypothetical protein